MNRKIETIKEVDCALIFMLAEERDLFLEHNKDFILKTKTDDNFIDFIFFDRNMNLRHGVICSDDKNMGNSQAQQLFYKLSRKYKSHLYINIGVAGLVDDVNIGDVLIVSHLSSFGENNANNTEKQKIDIYNNCPFALEAKTNLNLYLNEFGTSTENAIDNFKKKLKTQDIDLDKYKNLNDLKCNKIISGRCITVPEVIKNRDKYPELKTIRKINVIDMEAYYFALWHDLVKKIEPSNSIQDSIFLAIKSPSDYGDDEKNKFEACGSRKICMQNLYTVVSAYCTQIHIFKKESSENIYSYLNTKISNDSLDEIIRHSDISLKDFNDFFNNVIKIEHEVKNNDIIAYSKEILFQDNQALLLKGRTGTGKSTFISFLYKIISQEGKKCFLIDFSKFSPSSNPTEKQIITLLERLILQDTEYLMFLDGLIVGTETYNSIKNILDNNRGYSNLSFCIGNIDDDFNDLYNIVSSNKDITKIFFTGISVYSPMFDVFMTKSRIFFSNALKTFESEKISNFIKDAKINSVDFRLLSMFFNYHNDISRKKTLHTFIKDYLTNKYQTTGLKKYWSQLISVDNKPCNTGKDNYNSYFCSLAIAQGIIDIFLQNKENEIELFLKREFILSDEMNLLFEFLLLGKNNYNAIVENMLNSLNNYEVSISMETQLIYTLCRTTSNQRPHYRKLKSFIEQKISEIKDKLINKEDRNYYNYLIEYRTLCIAFHRCFDIKNYLEDFINELIKDENYQRCNLFFHLFYYSKREFDFNSLKQFDIGNADYEMFSNTYYTLSNSLMVDKNRTIDSILHNDPMVLLNILTFIHLVENLNVRDENYYIELIKHATSVSENLLTFLEESLEKKPELNNNMINFIILQIRNLIDSFKTVTN